MHIALKRTLQSVSLVLTLYLIIANFNTVTGELERMAAVSAFLNTSPTTAFEYLSQNNGQISVSASDEKIGITEKTETEAKKSSSSESTTSKKTVTAQAEEKVKGKITDSNLSNAGANTSYKNVYFNNCTGQKISVKDFVNAEVPFKIDNSNEPQVLIYHTHATECYMNDDTDYYTESDKTRTTDKQKNITAVGTTLANELKSNGFSVVHDTTLHDHPSYTGSYDNSAETIKKYLKKYPSIKIIIDLHRDSISSGENEKIAPTVTIDGKKAAQVMIVMGSNTGGIDNYPKWKSNLALASKLQHSFANMYPGLSRALLLRSSLYNQNLSTGAMLIEIGTDANTLEEAKYSAQLVA